VIHTPDDVVAGEIQSRGIADPEIVVGTLSVEAGRTLLFDREALLERASQAGIAIVASPRRY